MQSYILDQKYRRQLAQTLRTDAHPGKIAGYGRSVSAGDCKRRLITDRCQIQVIEGDDVENVFAGLLLCN